MSNQVTTRPKLPKATSQYDYVLLDGSGSMKEKWWPTLSAIQAYVDTAKRENVHSHITLQVFDSYQIEQIARDLPIDQWKNLNEDGVGANFTTTPLYDAINVMCRRLRDLDPPRCSILIVTDGDENASKYTNLVQAQALLNWCRAKGWQITFIGADFNNAQQSSLLGGDAKSAIGVNIRHLTDATTALAKKRARYGLYGTPMHWTEDEQQNFGGFLSGPSNSK